LTQLDHYRRGGEAGWRVAAVNQRPGHSAAGNVMA
jgi:hypothetical protein